MKVIGDVRNMSMRIGSLFTGYGGLGLPAVEDCLFRMLEPDEILAGMAFEPSYIVLGNRRERVRQGGERRHATGARGHRVSAGRVHPRRRLGAVSVKVITVQQPWASLIMARATNPRAKDVENRTWTTSHRGPLAIHAGEAVSVDGFPYAEYHQIELPDPLPLSVILGTVTLVDVVQDALSSWASSGQWNWVLADPMPFAEPVPARGALGLWEWSNS
jgi:hypothetical protein